MFADPGGVRGRLVWTRELAGRAGGHVRERPGADLAELVDSMSAPPPDVQRTECEDSTMTTREATTVTTLDAV